MSFSGWYRHKVALSIYTVSNIIIIGFAEIGRTSARNKGLDGYKHSKAASLSQFISSFTRFLCHYRLEAGAVITEI